MPRFVVLKHEVGSQLQRTSQTHYDWMFEVGDELRTFATDVIASLDVASEVEARLLANHRLEYLDFQGEISGQRGQVHRVIAGTYELRQQDDQEFSVQLHWSDAHGARIAQLNFYRNFIDIWLLRFTP